MAHVFLVYDIFLCFVSLSYRVLVHVCKLIVHPTEYRSRRNKKLNPGGLEHRKNHLIN